MERRSVFQVSLINIKNNWQLFELSKLVQFILNYDLYSISKNQLENIPIMAAGHNISVLTVCIGRR